MRRVEGAERLRDLRGVVLERVPLVDDQVAPPCAARKLRVHVRALRHLEGGDDDVVRLGVGRDGRHQPLPLLGVGRVQLDRREAGAEALELAHPGGEHREGRDDEVGPAHAEVELEVREEGDRLQRLAQPHLVGEDAVEPVVVAHRQPAQPVQLVVAHHHRPDLARLAERLVQRHRLRAALLWQLAAKQAEHLCVRRQVGDTLLHRGRLRRLELLPPPRPHRLLGARHARLLRRRRLLLRRRRLLRRPLPGGKRGVGGSLAQLAVPHGPLALLHVVHVLALDGEPAHHHRRGLEHPPAPPLLPCRRAGGRRRVAGGGSLRGA
mmetsp:Transcript_11043/g.35140  ORF Transcript_11043/g.35140 Transcript_11043/m.35140 type:complete len:322 (+) Transcript_11043:2994-3959(+)